MIIPRSLKLLVAFCQTNKKNIKFYNHMTKKNNKFSHSRSAGYVSKLLPLNFLFINLTIN